MAADVGLPDGYTLDAPVTNSANDTALPDGYTLDAAAPQGFAARESSDWAARNQQAQDIAARDANGQTYPQTMLQNAGNIAGRVADTAGNVIGSAARYANDLVPQSVDDAVSSTVNQAKDSIVNSDVGQAAIGTAKDMSQAYSQFSQAHPGTAADLDAIGNIAQLAPIAKAGGTLVSGVGDLASATGDAIGNARQAISPSPDFGTKLTMPIPTKKVALDQVGRTTEQGLLNTAVVQPTAQEQASIDAVKQIPGVSSTNSYQGNYNLIRDANNNEAQNLVKTLKANDVLISDSTVRDTMNGIRDNLANNSYVVGDGAKAADTVINTAMQSIAKNPPTASGILQARKDFDATINAQRGSKAFNPALESPISTAVQQVRQGINGMIAQAVPTAEVQTSLAKQSALYRAMDNIAPKAAAEGNNSLARLGQKIEAPLKHPAIRTATTIFGIRKGD